jgi:DNA-binding transcriptional LysR family regulator
MRRNPITIEVLETLDAIDRRGSFAKAAEELNKATSAVSYAVQKLEDQLDIALFQRQGRRSVLTPAGRLILAEGRDILQTTARLANKAKQVATGWEPRISIAVELLQCYHTIFSVLRDFLQQHPTIEVDVCESVLNGGWEALEQDRVDLLVGAPGPVPAQKGYRTVALAANELVLVISRRHELAATAAIPAAIAELTANVRRVVNHDTSVVDVARSAGLSSDGKIIYVQNMDQKMAAIHAGIGIGHLPRKRIESQLRSGELMALPLADDSLPDNFLAWKISNKGKGLQALSQQLAAALS